jgi:hypothetical protein
MSDCNCPKCQALPTKHRLAAERDQLAAALEDLLEVENDHPTDLDAGGGYRDAFREARAVVAAITTTLPSTEDS